MNPTTREDAERFLVEIGASPRLRRHAELVVETADELLAGLRKAGVSLDAEYVRVGAILHDAGKALHPRELDAPGHAHEAAGERLLLARGASEDVARVCRSNSCCAVLALSLEELVIALADKLWKGSRNSPLEEAVIARVALTTGRDRWEVFLELDGIFEEVASGADARLVRSAV